jgi:sugar phosphate isomerase/epimerase
MTGDRRVGLMLYSVRQACAADFEATLREVAAIGFEGVEIFDLHGHDPATVAGWLDELELTICGRHARLETIEDELAELTRESRTLGWQRLVVSWVDPAELGDATLDRLAVATTAVAEAGLELGYHNHDAEVEQGFLERLPLGVFLELDAGWAWYAGVDPIELLGRGPLVHIKDFRTRGERSFCPVGDGAIDYARIAPAAMDAGADWLIVEQDECEGSELDAARRSYAALQRMLQVPA